MRHFWKLSEFLEGKGNFWKVQNTVKAVDIFGSYKTFLEGMGHFLKRSAFLDGVDTFGRYSTL